MSKNKGFTLIEILVVLAILVILVISLAIIFKTSTEAFKKSDELVQLHQEARTILERMTKELQCAYILDVDSGTDITFEGYDESDNGKYDTTSDKDEVYFVAAISNSGDMDLVEVGYFLNNSHELKRHIKDANKSDVPPLDFDYGTGNSFAIAGDIYDLQFQYSPDGTNWQNTWNSSDSGLEKGKLPKAVSIKIKIEKGGLKREFSTKVFIPQR